MNLEEIFFSLNYFFIKCQVVLKFYLSFRKEICYYFKSPKLTYGYYLKMVLAFVNKILKHEDLKDLNNVKEKMKQFKHF